MALRNGLQAEWAYSDALIALPVSLTAFSSTVAVVLQGQEASIWLIDMGFLCIQVQKTSVIGVIGD